MNKNDNPKLNFSEITFISDRKQNSLVTRADFCNKIIRIINMNNPNFNT